MEAYKQYSKPFYYLGGLYLFVCTLLRIILLIDPKVHNGLTIMDYVQILFVGLLPNLLFFCLAAIPLWLYLLTISNKKLKKPYGWIILAGLMLLLLILLFTKNPIKAYGSVLLEIVVIFVCIKLLLNTLLYIFPTKRVLIREWTFHITIFIYTTIILLNALSEYFFFKEFGVRYNFIAVDYLIYTNEVIGNIMESYPVIPIFLGLGLISLTLTWWIARKTKKYFQPLPNIGTKFLIFISVALSILLAIIILPYFGDMKANNQRNKELTQNIYVSELASDGIQKFTIAFLDNDLDYNKFYLRIPQKLALQTLASRIGWAPLNNLQVSPTPIQADTTELHKNIVLITVESLSADYLAHYGNIENLTPFLDSLYNESLVFTNLYAAGNRTVRGLEALTLCIPPSPGESVIKRKDNQQKFSTGNLLKKRGYTVQFLYGGYSYFDNMQDFFSTNDYQIIDRNNFKPNEISFANIWGVADEDMARKMVQVLNQDSRLNKPFFAHWMTVSNHRPFTYPNGRVRIPGDAHQRKGGVLYTDYALHQFFLMAKGQNWYNNTVFIIVADHCASSAGKVALPLDKYRIPCIVFSPGFIKPQKISTLMSQIDIMPTVFGLLHFSYRSKFIGQDVLKKNYKPRAFMATYQDMGYLEDSILTVLAPLRAVAQYKISPINETPEGSTSANNSINLNKDNKQNQAIQIKFNQTEIQPEHIDKKLETTAISYYQTTSWLLKTHQYQALP
ncbi:Phosphoglycerol transferase MdoB [Arachidicoccus rhizosphaerae]|uniref:Phosphoglycerol transferase MdoB n=1 Tax=Arachidicoccus rhizosphaerae TaxID=551991 RepID=A0A1H4D1L8_9BACT|nr:LTA synthase family protein [Arachidicoccus rhizosphaerae]SEA66673.1 Phosphoglycerol transferase MdoB [Arachidicoccus rhizosphaerae]